MRVKFMNVGRGGATWEQDIGGLNEVSILRAIRARKVLASRLIEVEYDGIERGYIYAGDRLVGTFEVETDGDEPTAEAM